MVKMDSFFWFVKPYYEDKDIMHDLSHISRVLIYVEKLLKTGNYEAAQTFEGGTRLEIMNKPKMEYNVLINGIIKLLCSNYIR